MLQLHIYVYRAADGTTKGASAKAEGWMMQPSVVHVERADWLDSSVAISLVAGSRLLDA